MLRAGKARTNHPFWASGRAESSIFSVELRQKEDFGSLSTLCIISGGGSVRGQQLHSKKNPGRKFWMISVQFPANVLNFSVTCRETARSKKKKEKLLLFLFSQPYQ